MSSEKCSPHTEQIDMIILSCVCIFVFFVSNLSMCIFQILYEKIQYADTLDIEQLLPPSKKPSHFIGNWVISLCSVFDKHGYTCIAPWQTNTDFVSIEENDVVKNYWNILRIIN